MRNYAALTAFLLQTERWINEDIEITRAEGLGVLVGSDMDQLLLGIYQINARGGIGMEKPCNRSILAQHAYYNQGWVCEVGGQGGEREIDQLR